MPKNMPKHILLIEDESSIADNVIYSLETEGYAVTWVVEGGQGLEVMAQKNIDLVVLYVIISAEDYAFLMGGVLTFITLFVVMMSTRNIDWYEVGERVITVKSDSTD